MHIFSKLSRSKVKSKLFANAVQLGSDRKKRFKSERSEEERKGTEGEKEREREREKERKLERERERKKREIGEVPLHLFAEREKEIFFVEVQFRRIEKGEQEKKRERKRAKYG